MKFIIVTGGVISGLGKGITASSIGLLLKSHNLNVTAIKIDPYLNVDAGTMSPYEHGETYVLGDGGEADLDLGNYERFVDLELTKDHNITTGKIYNSVIQKERAGKYLGETVQIIPHITNEIHEWILRVSMLPVNSNNNIKPDVCIIEVGGTIGDIETSPFIESLRQMSIKYSKDHNFCFVHVSMIIDNGELKTKPTQQNIKTLRSLGINPDLLVLRTNNLLSQKILNKLSIFCHVKQDYIISNINVPNIYFVPKVFDDQLVFEKIAKILDLPYTKGNLMDYNKIITHFKTPNKKEYNLLIVGKYTGSQDTYLSIIRAIEHASFKLGIIINIKWLQATDFEELKMDNKLGNYLKLKNCDGIIIPGGFGSRGIKGKFKVVKYARENNIPILGICLGMQIMVCEFSHLIGLKGDSTEWNPNTECPIVDILPDQTGIMGGTMRLGNYETILDSNSLVSKLYGSTLIIERHRHRYEVNNKYVIELEKNGLKFVGKSSNNKLMEIVELNNSHPYFIGCQFHPEFRSRFHKPHPLFIGLLDAMIKN